LEPKDMQVSHHAAFALGFAVLGIAAAAVTSAGLATDAAPMKTATFAEKQG
jgi:hypothetical protein